MNSEMFKMMMEGLIATAIEKVCVLGPKDAKEDVRKIINLVEDLECFWEDIGDEKISWHVEITKAVEKLIEFENH